MKMNRERAPYGLEQSKILRPSQDKVPRFGWEAARRKRAAPPYSTARPQARQAPIEPQPAGRRSPAFFPGGQPKPLVSFQGRRPFVSDVLTRMLVTYQGFSELLGSTVCAYAGS